MQDEPERCWSHFIQQSLTFYCFSLDRRRASALRDKTQDEARPAAECLRERPKGNLRRRAAT
jgi:hypothetical protein